MPGLKLPRRDDAARTADVLRQFAWGVPAFVLAKVLTPPFFARQDTRRPMIFAVASVVITVILGSALFFWFGSRGWDGVLGLAIATSTSAWINVGLLGGVLMVNRIAAEAAGRAASPTRARAPTWWTSPARSNCRRRCAWRCCRRPASPPAVLPSG